MSSARKVNITVQLLKPTTSRIPEGPRRKLSTNDSVSPDTFAPLPRKDNRLKNNSIGCTYFQLAQPPCEVKAGCCPVQPLIRVLSFCQQKEEGKVQGQLNHTDSTQYIRDLKSQIEELKHEVRPPRLLPPTTRSDWVWCFESGYAEHFTTQCDRFFWGGFFL